MKISTNTINVLKNFAKINPSIVVSQGNVIKTISPSKTVMAKAEVDTAFPQNFAIYDLNQFIAAVTLLNNAEIEFKGTSADIYEGNEKSHFIFSDEVNITKAPDKEIKLPSVDVSFSLTADSFKKLERAAGVFNLPEFAVVGDGASMTVQVIDSKNPTGNFYSIDIGTTDKAFKAIFRLDNIKIIPGDYQVSISSRGISHFAGKEAEYWIAVEQNSVF